MDAFQPPAPDEIQKMLRVLMVEDSPEDEELVDRELTKTGYRLTISRVVTAAGMRRQLAASDWDVIISDYNVPGFGALPALEVLRQSGLDIPFIVLSGVVSDELAVAAMRAGAHDYLRKDNLSRLRPAVEREIQEAAQRRENRQMEAALRESEERFRAIATASSDSLYRMNADWSVMHSLVGGDFIAETEEQTQDWTQKYIHPDDRQRVWAAIHEAIRTKTMFELEHRVRTSDGRLGWTFSRAVPLMDANGEIVEWFGAASDITERKQMEEALRESEKMLRESQRIAGLGTFTMDLRTGAWTRSDILEQILGIDQSYQHTLAGWVALIHPDDRLRITDYAATDSIGDDHTFARDFRIVRPLDNAVRWLHGQRKLEFDAEGRPAILRGTARDITEQKEAAEKLRFAASVFSHAAEGIMMTASDGSILDVNDSFVRITGYSREEALGRNPRFLSSGRHDTSLYAKMWRALTEKGLWSGEFWNQRKNGEAYSVMQTITAVRDGNGKVLQYVSIFHDITRLKEQENRLKQIAYYDLLTNLPNRVLLNDRLRQAMLQAHRGHQLLGLALLDLDGFKRVNDNHGHEAGDQLLAALAVRMKNVLRAGDTLARLGGDEFVALLPDFADTGVCGPVLERLLDAVSKPVQIGEATVQVSASMGVAVYPQPEDLDADQLMRQADQAMYQAKLAGRNRVHFFDSSHDQSSSTRYESLNQIRQGLEANEFVLYYQPKVNMRTGRVVGAEALIRWQHPQCGLLLPATFLPVIEDHPLAVDLGEWGIESVLSQMESWQRLGIDLPVSVNLGALQLQQESFVGHLRKSLAAHPLIKPFSLELEVLETSALQDIASVSAVFEACREIGVRFALDDFGTGYSSLAYLKHLPANILKIDQSFVSEIVHDSKNLAILEALLRLAVAFQLEVIAEGVETVEHGILLLQLGCELGQGYGIAHPMQASELPHWCQAWRPDQRWANVLPTVKA